jgi:hypothetical protein
MNTFNSLIKNKSRVRSYPAVSARSLARWIEVDAYAQQSWAKRLPGVLLATLILTALLLWMGLPVWILH